jgi:DNA-binding MarR family transcriptional regulator
MGRNNQDEAYDLAASLQATFMSLESGIPEVVVGGRMTQMTLNQVRALHLIEATPGINQKDIARILSITRASVSVLIRKMVDLGLVDARPDKHDRRAAALHLTEAGRAIYDEVRRGQVAKVYEFLSVIPIETQRVIVEAMAHALGEFQKRV